MDLKDALERGGLLIELLTDKGVSLLADEIVVMHDQARGFTYLDVPIPDVRHDIAVAFQEMGVRCKTFEDAKGVYFAGLTGVLFHVDGCTLIWGDIPALEYVAHYQNKLNPDLRNQLK